MRTTTRAALIAVAGAAALLALSACTGPDPEPTRTKTPSPSASPSASSITDVTNAPGTGEGLQGALSDTKVTACELSDDSWTVAGTATNSTAAAADYRIYVSLLDGDGGTRALKEVDLSGVAPKATEKWSADIPLAEKGLSCVLRVERYAAG